MNIVYTGAFRLPNLDAAAPRVLNNAKILRELGHNIKFISWGGEYSEANRNIDGKYRVDGFEYIISNDLPSENSIIERVYTKLFRGQRATEIIKRESTPDLIILYNADYRFTAKMISFCRKRNIKLVNDITEWYDNNELKFVDIMFNHLNMTKLQHKIANKILISSYLSNYYTNSNNILIPPLCDKTQQKWSLTIDDDRIKTFDGITLIYAGTPGKKDCVHTVINAVNTLANKGNHIRFLILGITKESYLKKYSKYLLTTKLHSNIVFLGRVSQDIIPAYYQKADFMILLRNPNRKNMAGFPTKFAESMTAGIPVITNATSDLPKYVIEGKTGFLSKGYDYDSIMDVLLNKVLKLNTDDIFMMKMATEQNNSPFDWKSYTEQFKQFMQNLR